MCSYPSDLGFGPPVHVANRQEPPHVSFPRYLNWQNVGSSKDKIDRAFRHNLIIEDVATTTEEMQFDIVKEALDEAHPQFGHERARSFDMENHASELCRVVAETRQFEERITFLEQELSMLKQIVLQRPAAVALSTSAAAMHHPVNIHRQSASFVTPLHSDSEGYEADSQQTPGRASPLTVGSPRLRSHTAARNDGESLVNLPQENDADGNNVQAEADVEAVTTDKPPSNIAT